MEDKSIHPKTGKDNIVSCNNEIEYILDGVNFGWLCIAIGSKGNRCNFDPETKNADLNMIHISQ